MIFGRREILGLNCLKDLPRAEELKNPDRG